MKLKNLLIKRKTNDQITKKKKNKVINQRNGGDHQPMFEKKWIYMCFLYLRKHKINYGIV